MDAMLLCEGTHQVFPDLFCLNYCICHLLEHRIHENEQPVCFHLICIYIINYCYCCLKLLLERFQRSNERESMEDFDIFLYFNCCIWNYWQHFGYHFDIETLTSFLYYILQSVIWGIWLRSLQATSAYFGLLAMIPFCNVRSGVWTIFLVSQEYIWCWSF